jgi:hypothetical protein
MDTFQITDSLRLEKHRQGAMVHYTSAQGEETDVFCVGLNGRSLQACRKALTRGVASWETNDGSLRVVKREGEVTLAFKLQGPPYGSRELVLKGAELSKFQEAVAQLAAG